MPATLLNMFPGMMSGKRLVDEGEIIQLLKLMFSTQSVAGAVTAPGPLLTGHFVQITTGLNVLLPPALAGRQVVIQNEGTATANINAQTSNPANSGLPDVVGAANPNGDVPAGTAALFTCFVTGHWVEIGAIFAPPPPLAAREAPTTTTANSINRRTTR